MPHRNAAARHVGSFTIGFEARHWLDHNANTVKGELGGHSGTAAVDARLGLAALPSRHGADGPTKTGQGHGEEDSADHDDREKLGPYDIKSGPSV